MINVEHQENLLFSSLIEIKILFYFSSISKDNTFIEKNIYCGICLQQQEYIIKKCLMSSDNFISDYLLFFQV